MKRHKKRAGDQGRYDRPGLCNDMTNMATNDHKKSCIHENKVQRNR